MYEPEEPYEPEYTSSDSGPAGYSGETDRVNGEYHYKNGYTQRIYSDAHYVPVDETTEPRKYYEPPERKQPSVKKARPHSRRTARRMRLLCACLACLVLGSAVGALAAAGSLQNRIRALEADVETLQTAAGISAHGSASILQHSASRANTMTADSIAAETSSANDIYQMACKQVVGITTEVTYANFFGRTTSSAVSGTGFFITADGYILTNYHVIEYAYEYGYAITVMTHDGTRYDADIVGVEESNDLAILKIAVTDACPVQAADSSALQVGDEVYAVGNPLGELDFSMTFGRVSALDRVISTDTSGDVNMFQFDAAVNSGNSGGPLYDCTGCVVGIVTAKYSSDGVEGLGFAIPINDAANIAGDIITVGYVTGKATLGVSFDSRYTSVYSMYYGMPEGAYVSEVQSGSCAEAAGLTPGDIITAINSTSVTEPSDVSSLLRNFAAGDTARITYYRSGVTLTTDVTFDEYVPRRTAQS